MAVAVEVRTINSRHFKLSYRASEGYASARAGSRSASRARSIRRGTVQLNLRVDRQALGRRLSHQHRRARKLSPAARSSTRGRSEWNDPIDLRMLLSLPGAVDEHAARRPRSARRLAGDRAGAPRGPGGHGEDAGRRRRRAGRRPGPQRPADSRAARRRSPSARPRSRSRINRGSRSACSRRSRS